MSSEHNDRVQSQEGNFPPRLRYLFVRCYKAGITSIRDSQKHWRTIQLRFELLRGQKLSKV